MYWFSSRCFPFDLIAFMHIISYLTEGAATGSFSSPSTLRSSSYNHRRHYRSPYDGHNNNNHNKNYDNYQSDGTPPRLEILPGAEMKAEVAKSFVLNCMGRGGDPKLFTDLKWFNPKGEEIFPSRDISVTSTNNAERKILAFMRPTLSDGGTYTCRGYYQNTDQLEAKVEVTIYEGVVWKDCPEVQALVKGNQNELIKCTAVSNPPPDITWLKDGSPVDTIRYSSQTNGIQILGSSAEVDAGTYSVMATVQETGQLELKDITVEVHIRPNIIEIGPGEGVDNKELEVTDGEEAKLNCRAEAAPKSYYSWLDPNSRNVSERYGYVVNRETGELIITKVRKDDDLGSFKCVAENHAGSDAKELYVNVLTKPVIVSFLNVSAAERTNTKLECRASGNPLPDIKVRKDGMDTNDKLENVPEKITVELLTDRNEAVISLQVLHVERSDDGLYYCTASNRAGKAESAGHLEVQYPPDMSENPSVVKTWENHEVNITCVANAVPNATVTWFNSAGVPLTENYRYRIFNYPGKSQLTVDPRQPDAWGTYRCKAINIHGEASSQITLEQAFPPTAITKAHVEKESPQSITFNFEGPENTGGLPITKFHVVYFESQYGQPDTRRHSWPVNNRNRYTINDLRPKTQYTFRFSAQNDAGLGPEGAEIVTELPHESQPEKVQIIHESSDCCSGGIISRFSQNYLLRWTEPANNGRPIESYDIKYYKVRKSESGDGVPGKIKWEEDGSPLMETIAAGEELSYRLQNLEPSNYYRIEITARNSLGNSLPAYLVFRTADFASDGSGSDGSSGVVSCPLPTRIFVTDNRMVRSTLLLAVYFMLHLILLLSLK